MFKSLVIKNYVLIDSLELDFSDGFSVLTGETGAGKSILLGALGLLLGDRADISAVSNKVEKCLVEGIFDISNIDRISGFFEKNDLEYDGEIAIRRILFPGGKSRAFINELPVTLDVLKKLSHFLIDVHSQHQNLLIKDPKFQLGVIDAFADNSEILDEYREKFVDYKSRKKIYDEFVEGNEQEKQNLDFYQHQLEKFEILDLDNLDIDSLDKEFELMQNGSVIQQNFSELEHHLDGGDSSVMARCNQMMENLSILKKYLPEGDALIERLNSILVEMEDIKEDVQNLASGVIVDPQRLSELESQMSTLYQLFETFRVQTVSELMKKKQELEEKIANIVDFEVKIEKLTLDIEVLKRDLKLMADAITTKRKSVFPRVEESIVSILQQMGMPHVQFLVEHKICSSLSIDGQDQILFLFSANLGQAAGDVAKSASGGEISRIMFALKSLLSDFSGLPTIIFDEIDTGISGNIAEKMGGLMKKMGATRQILTITHLPQIAAKGDHHLLVEKDHLLGKTTTSIRKISDKARVNEIAQMLSGADVGESAMAHAEGMIES